MTPAADVVGRAPESLSLTERHALAGLTIAVEIYTPATLPDFRIAAIGESASDCAQQLAARGVDPRKFEYVVLKPAY